MELQESSCFHGEGRERVDYCHFSESRWDVISVNSGNKERIDHALGKNISWTPVLVGFRTYYRWCTCVHERMYYALLQRAEAIGLRIFWQKLYT